MQRHMHLNLFIHSRGHHEAAWRHPAASPLALSDNTLGCYRECSGERAPRWTHTRP
jgi:hypothetical protein